MGQTDYVAVARRALESYGLTYQEDQYDDETVFGMLIELESVPSLHFTLLVNEHGDCKLRSILKKRVPSEKFPDILICLNQLNQRYRFITLALDGDADIQASYDVVLTGDQEAVQKQYDVSLNFFVNICDECMTEILRVLLAETPTE